MPESARSGERIFRGIPVSAGVSKGKVLVLGRPDDAIPRGPITPDQLPHEIERLELALVRTRQQLLEVQRQVHSAMGAADARIFDAHLLVLDDPALLDEVVRVMTQKLVRVEQAFHEAASRFIASLENIKDDYLRERAADIRDVTARVLNNLLGRTEQTALAGLREPCIIVSHDLSPSTTATLNKELVLGLATEVGSKTSHTAILARSLQIPAVVGVQNVVGQIQTGQYALLDGFTGALVLQPTDQTLFEYGQLVRKHVDFDVKLRAIRDQPAVTLDGVDIVLSANIEHAADAGPVRESGAQGVGLFRTEYLFLNRETLPSEEEQFEEYHKVVTALKPQGVIIRTLDLGGDKFLSHLQLPREMNPFLGWRAIRYCLQEPAVFRTQMRAILRASAEGNVKLMFPMISGLEELTQAIALLEDCKNDLRRQGVPFDERLEVGVMIEVPSAVIIAESLARRVNFFSIGTNDLIQYTLAVDRLNERIAHLYEPTHPAILQLIRRTVDAARQHHIWVGVCGEMAGDPALVPLLLGLGVDELSVAVSVVPQVKFLIRRLKMAEARKLAQFALNCENAAEILEQSQRLARQVAPGLFETDQRPAA